MLTQSEADALFAMPKKPKSSNGMIFPHAGEKILTEFVSLDGREDFFPNITRGSIEVYNKAFNQKLWDNKQGGYMQTNYKEKILQEIEKIPEDKLANMYKIIHLLTGEITSGAKKTGKKVSLKGIWKGSLIDDSMFAEAKKSLFPYEKNRGI